jgi:hypothetical protein
MKVSSLLLLAAFSTLGAASAFAFAEFARGEAVLSTTARALYDSRVYGGFRDADDYIFTLDPRVIYRREAGQIKFSGEAGVRINRYANFSELDSEDALASLRLWLPADAATLSSGSLEASYDEHTDVNYDVNTRVREKTFNIHADGNIPTGLKTSVVLGGTFRRDQRSHFNDRDTRSGFAGFRYSDFLGGSMLELLYRRLEVESAGQNFFSIPIDQQSDTITATFSRPIYHDVRGSLSYGYRTLHRSRAEVLDPDDTRTAGSIVSVKLDGPFLPQSRFPKLESSLVFGFQKADAPGVNDVGGTRFVGHARIAWHARERTQLYVEAHRLLELSTNDLTVETSSARIGVNQEIGDFTSANLSGGYERREYQTLRRNDDILMAQLGLRYRITKAWSASGNYRVRSTDSTNPIADYDRHVVYVSAIYTF